MEQKKKTAKELQEKLTFKKKHVLNQNIKQLDLSQKYCEGYKDFLNQCKTEKECVKYALKLLTDNGYKEFDPQKKYVSGDKIYCINRGKAIISATIGTEDVDRGIRLASAHIDSPRIDLKAHPVFEEEEICYFKSRFYGGIRNYQWVTIPLAIHGSIYNSNGDILDISIGENNDDPIFYISDLLPHLSSEQEKRPLSEGVKGEELNIILGSLPFLNPEDEAIDDLEDLVKLNVLNILNEKYDLTERNFSTAEIQIVPAFRARDVGFDRSLIAAYGQDNRSSAYSILQNEIKTTSPTYTTICVLTDKEEIGSVGNTGLNSRYVFDFMEYLAEMQNVNEKTMFRNTKALTVDVTAGFDPTFPDPFDKKNAAHINKGCVLVKYTGGPGKSDGSEADSAYMHLLATSFDKNGIIWQAEDFGTANETGGGGTDTQFVTYYNIDVIDIGVPVIAMHSPYELTSKLDLYNLYLAVELFYKI